MLTQQTLAPYLAMRESGSSPAEVYAQAFDDCQAWHLRQDILRMLYGLEGDDLLIAVDEGDELALELYFDLRDDGASPAEVSQQVRADGHTTVEAIRVLWKLYGLSGIEAKNIVMAN